MEESDGSFDTTTTDTEVRCRAARRMCEAWQGGAKIKRKKKRERVKVGYKQQ